MGRNWFFFVLWVLAITSWPKHQATDSDPTGIPQLDPIEARALLPGELQPPARWPWDLPAPPPWPGEKLPRP